MARGWFVCLVSELMNTPVKTGTGVFVEMAFGISDT